MLRIYKHTFYEVYITRTSETLDPSNQANPISKQEWLQLLEQDQDLALNHAPKFANHKTTDQEAWKILSYPEGTPIFYDSGQIYIREEDSQTIEKLVSMAKKLDAKVIGEDGTEFEDLGEEVEIKTTPEQANQQPNRQSTISEKVLIDDEIVRKRQSLLVVFIGLFIPAYVLFLLINGENPGVFYIAGFCSLALSFYATILFFKTKYYLSWDGSKKVILYLLDTKSTNDKIIKKEFLKSELNPLELIWLPLEYPAKTKTEYHVRSQKLTWLVFLATSQKEKSQKHLDTISKKLFVSKVDRSRKKAATNIPKKYQLTGAEKGRGRKKK